MMKIKQIVLILFIIASTGGVVGYFFNSDNNKPELTHTDQNNERNNTGTKANDFHRSFYSQKDFFDESFKKLGDVKVKNNNIKGIVVNHHLLAPNLIAKAFSAAATDKPITIVLISPNHFSVGRGQILSSLYDWQTPYGILESDKTVIEQLQQEKVLAIDEIPFEKEHGISNLVTFIKKTFPNAKIVPIIIKDSTSDKENEKLASALNNILPDDALVVASLDFSHYLPSNAADFHDAKSEAVLENFDYDGAKFLDIDSKTGLTVFLKYLDQRGAKKFILLDHSNSAKVTQDKTIQETTSYITGYFSAGDKNKNSQVTLLSFGDLMLDRYIRKVINENDKEFPFEKIKRFLSGNDITLVNLEGSFTDFTAKPYAPNNLTFTFDPEIVPALKKLGFSLFNLANNHSFNFGKTGFTQSQNYLKNNNLDYFGEPFNSEDVSIIEDIRGTKIGFVGYHQLTNTNFDNVIAAIKELKQRVDFVVVYTHWGVEYQTDFSARQQQEARQLVDAGADVVLGSHPHVVQPVEIYHNKAIFYSLGNFLFDQTFSQKTQQGLGVGIVFDLSRIEYYLFPTKIKDFQVILPNQKENDILLKELAENSLVTESIKQQIIQGKIIIDK